MASNRERLFSKPSGWDERLAWLDTEHVEVSTTPLNVPSEIKWQYQDGEWTAEVGAPKLQTSQSDAPKSEETDEIGASKCEMRDFDAEHAEGCSTEVGKTSAISRQADGDSREKLMDEIAMFVGSRRQFFEKTQAWLDRQAAITRAELVDCANCPITERNAEVIAELREQLDETKHAIAKAGGTWTEREDGAVAVVFAPNVDKLRAKLDALKRAVSDAGGMWMEEGGTVTAAFAPDVDELTAERDKLKADLEAAHEKNRALKAHIGKMQNGRHGWHVKAKELEEQNDELRETVKRLQTENENMSYDVDSLQDAVVMLEAENHDYSAKVDEWQAKMDSLKTERDEWIYAAELARAERDKLREELRIEREAVEACEGCDKVDSLTDERDKYREKFGKALDLAGEIGRIAE